MTSGWKTTRKAITGLLLAGVAVALLPAPANAQQSDAERLRRIESELRALQRAVFPGGDGRYFTPEVDTSPSARPQQPAGEPTATALTAVLARLDALEAQLSRLTARSEENTNELSKLETKVDEAIAAARSPAVAAAAPSTGIASTSASSPAVTTSTLRPTSTPTPAVSVARTTPTPTPTPAETTSPRTTPASTSTQRATPAATTPAPSPARVAAVQAVAKPQTEDAGDDEYSYGFRLWEKGFYPEAQQQLALFLEKYPRHARVSFARNLLGRAYLDNGQPRDAATHFFENYNNDPQGARAPDSLLFLAESMITLGDTDRACIALARFSETFPALATGRLKEQYDRDRSKVTCPRR